MSFAPAVHVQDMSFELASFDQDFKLLAVSVMLTKTKDLTFDGVAKHAPPVGALLAIADCVQDPAYKSMLTGLLLRGH